MTGRIGVVWAPIADDDTESDLPYAVSDDFQQPARTRPSGKFSSKICFTGMIEGLLEYPLALRLEIMLDGSPFRAWQPQWRNR